MKKVVTLTSVNNDKVKYFLSLTDKKIRNKEHKFLIEGYHLVEEASKTPFLEAVITTDEANFNKFKNVDKYLVTMPIIEKLSSTKNPQNILGVVRMQDHSIDNLSKLVKMQNIKLLLLDEINDPGNLGTIIRTAAALDYDAIVMSNTTVDMYNDKVLRSTQGVIFKIPLIKTNLIEAIKLLKQNNITCFGTSLDKAVLLDDVKKVNRFAICMGNEARGVSKEVLDLMDQNIKIEMNKDVESLNVSIASAIIMYNLKK